VFFDNYKLQLQIFYAVFKILFIIGDFSRKLHFVEFVEMNQNESHHDNKYPSSNCRAEMPFLIFFPSKHFKKMAHAKIYQHQFPSISRHSDPSGLLRRTNFSFCLPAVIFPLFNDGSLDEFKVNLGYRTVLWRMRGIGWQRPRATCHREPPGSARLTLISLLR